jgi:hypothetical protein
MTEKHVEKPLLALLLLSNPYHLNPQKQALLLNNSPLSLKRPPQKA